MKLKRIQFKSFRRFQDFSLDFHENLTVLVARNGAGKSSILDGIAILLGPFLTHLPELSGVNFKATDFQEYPTGIVPHKSPYMRISGELTSGEKWDRTEKRDKSEKTAQEIPDALGTKALKQYADSFIDRLNSNTLDALPIIAYYGTERAVFDYPQRKRNFRKQFSRFEALKGGLESKANFKKFVEYFYALEAKEYKKQQEKRSFDETIPELVAIRKAIHEMLPEFSNPVSAEPAGISVDWTHDGVKETLRIEQLSDGYRSTIAMAMDIAARMAEANPEMSDPLQTEGIVMIDEVDLHLHPGWQQTILLDLMRTFPNVQFIVSTHSPQVISSVKPECLRVINWTKNTPTLQDVSFSEGAEAQQILLDILGLESPRVQALPIVQALKEYQKFVENDQWDTPEALKLEAKLQQWGGQFDPEIARLKMDIRMKEWERKQS